MWKNKQYVLSFVKTMGFIVHEIKYLTFCSLRNSNNCHVYMKKTLR